MEMEMEMEVEMGTMSLTPLMNVLSKKWMWNVTVSHSDLDWLIDWLCKEEANLKCYQNAKNRGDIKFVQSIQAFSNMSYISITNMGLTI